MLYRILVRILLPFFSASVKTVDGIEYLPRHGPFLLAANHVDYFDGFFITRAVTQNRPHMVKFLSETNNYWWSGGATIPIDRNDKSGSLITARAALQGDVAVCIFMEGHRNLRSVLAHGKTGAARLVQKSHLPIIPVGITAVPGNTYKHSFQLLLTGKQKVIIRFGKPIIFNTEEHELSKEMLDTMTTAIMRAVGPLCRKTYQG